MRVFALELDNDIKGIEKRDAYIEGLIRQLPKPELVVLPELSRCSYMASQAMWKYADNPRSQPFDQHLLLACVAPRNLLLECYHKKWFDPKGEFLAAQAASPVWTFLTGRGLGLSEMPPAYDDVRVVPPFGYVRRTECHGLSPYDWKWALDFAESEL